MPFRTLILLTGLALTAAGAPLVKDRGFGLEVVKHGGAGDTGVFSDFVHRRALEALLDEQFHGRGVDPLARREGPDDRPIAAGGRLSPRDLLRLSAGPGARVSHCPFPSFTAHEFVLVAAILGGRARWARCIMPAILQYRLGYRRNRMQRCQADPECCADGEDG